MIRVRVVWTINDEWRVLLCQDDEWWWVTDYPDRPAAERHAERIRAALRREA